MDYSEYKNFAEQFALIAGDIMRENFRIGMKKEWKSDVTPVTEVDIRVNKLLIKEIEANFPEHSILAEEESHMKEGAEFVWVCDPVDGTLPYSHGLPIATFSLALVYRGESVVGVVYDPFQDRLFSATKNGGAFLNGTPITVSDKKELHAAVGNFESGSSDLYNLCPLAEHLIMKEKTKLTKLSSPILPTALIATGEFAFSLFPSKSTHDAAAVKVIVEEAGGKFTDIFGNEQRYDQPINGFIASNGLLHDQLVTYAKRFLS